MKKPLPIAIAEAFEQLSIDHLPDGYPAIQQKKLNAAAAVLRAQHAHINEFLAACKLLIDYCDKHPPMGDSLWSVQLIRAAIKKTEAEQQ